MTLIGFNYVSGEYVYGLINLEDVVTIVPRGFLTCTHHLQVFTICYDGPLDILVFASNTFVSKFYYFSRI